jgi:Nicotinate phosphoribosyltransferase (NAPRTase) family
MTIMFKSITLKKMSQNGPAQATGYWSTIYVRDGDAWKIRMSTFNQTLLCEKMVQPTAGSYSADHLIFGMGDGLLQQVNRDTQRFGIKCSNLTTNRF